MLLCSSPHYRQVPLITANRLLLFVNLGGDIACACMLERLSDILRGGAISHPGILGEQIDVPYDLLRMAFPTLYELYLEQ
ncbi:hypothetical protein PGT21_011659 [Puccinia graminis f. sp. tritici]|uniref:Uncharacterized protein n=1 Tax=Puccinia graminis f. sp. tritici TaxID=56615 RepID=A0A5B0N0F3_PUCGR|nr:hypothetical protein PGT21_011659 [Puccinia graminis f. sp. tritici]KAA1088077.1 hypothetical protein PGTUg99_027608 [Puccinia graminis f. sp. tritici]